MGVVGIITILIVQLLQQSDRLTILGFRLLQALALAQDGAEVEVAPSKMMAIRSRCRRRIDQRLQQTKRLPQEVFRLLQPARLIREDAQIVVGARQILLIDGYLWSFPVQ